AKGYIGTGYTGAYVQDFWEWNQSTNQWTQKANFAGSARAYCASFAIGTKGYIGAGDDGGNKKDFWEWDQATNTWTQKSDLNGLPRFTPVGFSIGSNGYVGTGMYLTTSTNLQDFMEYCP